MIQNIELLRSWLALTYAPNLGPVRIQSLIDTFQNPLAVLEAGKSAWTAAGLSEKTIHYLSAPNWEKVESELKWADQDNSSILCLGDESYPEMLKDLVDAPPVLYALGLVEILNQPQLAIVGSRNPTHAGLETAHEFAAHLASMGLTITSGMALGIDAAAHQGALSVNKGDSTGDFGYTVAVAGTGLDRVYPARNRDLAHQIAEHGVLVSEYSLGTPPLPGNFPRRNRIISGLSMGVFVVEAALQSGSLITARYANEQGREVFALPGSVHHPLAKGCHALIREGAKLVETAEHILEELGGFIALLSENNLNISKVKVKPEQNNNDVEESKEFNPDIEYKQVLNCIDYEPTSVDRVVERCGLTADAVCSMLLVLELQGYVTALSGGYYCISR